MASPSLEREWTDACQQQAFDQGWGIFAVDGNEDDLEIQRLDETMVFDSDGDAFEYVLSLARNGDPIAILALELTPPF